MSNILSTSLLKIAASSVFGLLFVTSLQAATFSEVMKIGMVSGGADGQQVVIYNDDYSKCLSAGQEQQQAANSVVYTSCQMDDSDTWLITSNGKIQHKSNEKCLGTPKGKDRLELTYCNYVPARDYQAFEFIIFPHVNDSETKRVK